MLSSKSSDELEQSAGESERLNEFPTVELPARTEEVRSVIHVLIDSSAEDVTEVVATLEGPSCKLEDKMREWLEGLIGPEPKAQEPVWEMRVADRRAHWQAKKEWEQAVSDYTSADFVKWLVESSGFVHHEYAVCLITPLKE